MAERQQCLLDTAILDTHAYNLVNIQVMEFVCSKKGRKRTNIVIIEKCRCTTVVENTDIDCQPFTDLSCHVPIVSFTFTVMKEIQKE